MKQKLLIVLIALLLPMAACAYDVCIDGIYYNIVKKAKQATVTYGDNKNGTYSGDVVIPETVVYEGVTCNVIAIGENAFLNSKPTSVTIPSSVRSIGENAFFFGYHKMDGLYISDMAAWCEIEFSGNSESDWDQSPLYYSNHFYLNGEEVIDLVIPDGVTKINSFAFCGAKMLKSAKLPESVMSIGAYAFMGCTGLQSVNIPEGITTIDSGVFKNCGVSSFTIPNSVTSIGWRAFCDCKNLKSLTIGNGIKTIESQAFAYLDNLEDVYISDLKSWIQIWKEPSNNFSFGMSVADGPVHYQPLEYAKHLYLNGKEIKDLVIPEGVTTVPADAFLKFVGLTSATIPDWVESFAFSSCANLKTITVGNGTDKIKVYGCESLSDLEIGSGTSIYISTCNSLKKIATSDITTELKVEKCEKLETLVLGKSIQKCEISGCKELANVYCSVVPCFNSASFDDDCQIEFVTLHVPEIVLNDYAATEPWKKFGNIIALKNGDPGYIDYSNVIQFADSKVRDLCLKNWDTNGDQLLTPKEAAAVTDLGTVFSENKTITSFDELKYFTGLTAIGDKAFYNCSKLLRITIPANVKTIGDFAFNGCSNLSDVALPDGVTAIGQYGFYGCSSFTKLNIPKGVTKININTYADCEGIKEIIIPDHIVEIGNFAFARKSGGKITYEKVYIPSSVKTIGEYIFDYVEVKNVYVPDITTWWNSPFVGKDFCRIDRSSSPKGSFRLFANGSEVVDLVIPSDITTIPDNKFYGCTSLASLKFSGKVRFGAYAFQKCTGLTSVLIPIENKNDLGDGAFRECSNLTDVYLPLEKPFGINRGTAAPFSSISNNATLHVPEGSVDAYIKQNYWTYWFSNIVALQEGDPGYEKPNDGVTLMAKSYTRTYGDANPTFEYTVTGGTITSGTPAITCSATATSPVGTYDIVISKGTVSNSTLNLVKGTLTITKAPLTISAGNYTKKEGENNPTFKATYSGFKNNETEAVLTKKPTITTTATKTSPAGSYPVTVSGAEAQNYNISYQNGTLTITASGTPSSNAEPYAVLSNDNTVLTFYYDSNKASRGGMSVGPFNYFEKSGWYSYRTSITTVVFDASFANCTSITSTYDWFSGCRNLKTITGIKNLRTDNVTIMNFMFMNCSSLTDLDLSTFNTEKVSSMNQMFSGCTNLKSLNVGNFKNDNVDTMLGMFKDCSSLTNLDLTGFNTSKVTIMDKMFYNCKSLDIVKLSSFNTENVTNMRSMFSGCSCLTSLDLSRFNTSKVTDMGSMFSECSNLTSLNLSGFNTSNVTTMSGMFNECSTLTNLDLSGFNTSNVTTMSGMFSGCKSLTSLDLSGFNTSNVTNVSYMFRECSSLTSLDLSGFNTSNVTNVSYMFYGCKSLTSLDLSGFSTSKVTDMSYMFSGCKSLTSLDLSGFSTSNVTDMSYMFKECSNLTSLDLSGFNTSNVTDMSYMFRECSSLTSLDLSGFNTSNVTDMFCMFVNCTEIETIYVGSKWSTAAVKIGTFMFNGCKKLVGGAGTKYHAGRLDFTYAHIDGGTANPGYFTDIKDKNKNVTLTAKSYSRVYGDPNPTFEYTVTGGTITSGAPTITCSATATSPVGTYDIVIAKGTVSNSNVELVKGTLTITKAPLTISAGNYTKVEGEDNPTFTPTYSGFKNGETEAVLTKKPIVTCEANKDSEPGSYEIKVSGAKAQNYDISYVSGWLTIEENPNKFEEDDTSYEILDDGTVAITKDWKVQHTQVLPTIVLYDGKSYTVTVIGADAFRNNQNLTQITIPNTITSIGDGAFAGCVNLAVIIIHVENPIDIAKARTRAGGSSVFEGVDKETCILYVPDGSVEAYKTTDGWNEFKNILPISALGIDGVYMNGKPFDIYTLQGRKVRHEATSLDGLPKGVYIINGRKVVK